MQCRKCRFQNPEGAKYCSECGARLELACPHCRKANPAESKFCNECGRNLRDSEEAPATTSASQRPPYTPKFLAETYLAKPG
ncbi:MAG: zinc ribbon domain-containing protein, partial [Desulfobacteraceae bacterium]|nr:zinc ribbon domain-containing protein [Desulfobacteraceae bacterium]